MSDVVVIGGGVIGLTLAYELAGRGVAVAVLDQGPMGQESSWAGAGILPPGNPAKAATPESQLRAHSHVLWPRLSEQLRNETGIDNGFRRCGGIEVRLDGHARQLEDEIENWRTEGVEVERLDERVFEYEPRLNRDAVAAYRLPQMGQVRNPRHLKALIAGCLARGVTLRTGCPAQHFSFDSSCARAHSVSTTDGKLSAAQFVLASGAWSNRFVSPLSGMKARIRPLRGQIVQLTALPSPIRHVVNVGLRYLVPRDDGRILVGSTEEAVGFDKRNTAEAVGDLIAFGRQVVPELASATFERAWSGLRPHSLDGLPYLGQVPGSSNLFIAAGHFRSGLQLSPITAAVMTQLLLGEPTTVDLHPFRCDREGQWPGQWAVGSGQ
jgi:glycine oxidase